MITTILIVYLSGFAITETYTVYNSLANPTNRTTTGESIAISTAMSLAWPIVVPWAIKEKIEMHQWMKRAEENKLRNPNEDHP